MGPAIDRLSRSSTFPVNSISIGTAADASDEALEEPIPLVLSGPCARSAGIQSRHTKSTAVRMYLGFISLLHCERRGSLASPNPERKMSERSSPGFPSGQGQVAEKSRADSSTKGVRDIHSEIREERAASHMYQQRPIFTQCTTI